MVIQIVVTAVVVLFVLPNIYSSYKRSSLSRFGVIIWALFWIIGLVIIWFPELIGLIGSVLGVERSIDALVYISIVYLLYISFKQKIRISEVNKEITELNRTIALSKLKK